MIINDKNRQIAEMSETLDELARRLGGRRLKPVPLLANVDDSAKRAFQSSASPDPQRPNPVAPPSKKHGRPPKAPKRKVGTDESRVATSPPKKGKISKQSATDSRKSLSESYDGADELMKRERSQRVNLLDSDED